MGRGPPSFRTRTVGIHQQAAFIRQVWPNFECRIQDGRLVCRGEVRPTDISRTYRVCIIYRGKHSPSVRVVDPPLRRRPSEPREGIPHTFNQATEGQEEPCLYKTAWRSDMLLANTIIPWLYEWLMFYEIWYQTGKWLGGGIGHGNGKGGSP